jgi:hypothetical protein
MKNEPSPAVPSVAEEFAYADLGDARRTGRLRIIAESWSAAPDQGVPTASKSSAKTEATYRFLNNPGVTYAPIVDAHIEQTRARVAEARTAIVAHDTTEFAFGGEAPRTGLGRLKGGDQGFLGHLALAISAEGRRRPLGILGFAPWVRSEMPRRKKANGRKKSGSDYAKETGKESARWGEMVADVSGRGGASLIHVMDREADAYPLLWQLVEGRHRFVVRVSKDRVVQAADSEQPTELLSQALGRVKGLCEIEVPLSRRASSSIPAKKRTFGPREARVARLQIAVGEVRVQKPRYETGLPKWLDLKVVHLREIDAPEGTDEVDWKLYTTEPIGTMEEVRTVIEHYRARWLIEEFFKALKTGCAVEKRQHESLHALLNAVAICLPIAWNLLLLRNRARSTPEASATEVLTPTQIEVLRTCAPTKLDDRPTVRQVLFAVAALGGHLKSNGDPGWQVLGRGMQYLLTLETGWQAGRQRSDR